jgi:hypothetical protein
MYNEIKSYIEQHNGKTFVVTYKNGNKEKRRLFVSSIGNICEFSPRSRKRGMPISVDNFAEIVIKNNDVSAISVCRNNLRLVIKYLTASGMWKDMLRGAQFLQTLSDEELLTMRTWDEYHKVMTKELADKGIEWFSMDCFANLFIKRIKTMAFESYERDYYKRRIKESFINKENIRHRWTKGYDNSFEVRFDKDYPRGWYSEEYRGCGNGHYYFLLDECHALFGEDD